MNAEGEGVSFCFFLSLLFLIQNSDFVLDVITEVDVVSFLYELFCSPLKSLGISHDAQVINLFKKS